MFEHGPPIGENNLALLGDHIVVLDNVFADIKVVALYPGLCILDEARDKLALQRHILLHPDPLHNTRHTVGSETTHQFIIKGQIEARRTRISLASCTTTQLVIDTARFVPLGTDDMQSTQCNDVLMILFTLTYLLLEELILLLISHVRDVFLDGLFLL